MPFRRKLARLVTKYVQRWPSVADPGAPSADRSQDKAMAPAGQ
jgi:hypothetical protein